MAKISLQNISKQYKDGEIQALQRIDFEVPDGKFFCLLGPAGAGKTTTIKMIAGIEAAESGKIYFDDEDITDRMPMDRDVAVAFETYALYPQHTVRENLSFPLQAPRRRKEWSSQAIEARVVEIANLLGIGELLDRFPRQLSGGQRQRVGLGRALVRRPKAYLLDEPIAHLDAKLRHRMRGELKRIQIETAITTIYTTPDQLEALSLADVMAVINAGAIEQLGTPQDVYKYPANVFVARFVGDPPMNILEAEIEDGAVALPGELRLAMSAPLHQALASRPNGRRVLLGIRPKDIRILPAGSDQAAVKSQVKHVQVLGETSIATITNDLIEMHAKVATDSAPRRGENVALSFDIASCHFFDIDTRRRIAGL